MNSIPDSRSRSPVIATKVAPSESLSLTIVRAVAALENEEPNALPPLFDAVDADALTSLAEAAPGKLRISFQYCGYEVVVTPTRVRLY